MTLMTAGIAEINAEKDEEKKRKQEEKVQKQKEKECKEKEKRDAFKKEKSEKLPAIIQDIKKGTKHLLHLNVPRLKEILIFFYSWLQKNMYQQK